MSNNKRRFFLRYISIIQKLRTIPVSFDEIESFLKRQSRDSSEDLSISKRTFQRDLNDIRDVFDIDILCNHDGYYFISDNDRVNGRRTLETFDQLELLYRTKTNSKYVQYENRGTTGTEHLNGLLHAIRNRYLVSFQHEKFWEDSITNRTVEPLAIKESQHRWYLVAKDNKDDKIKTFGLERISGLTIERIKFDYPKDFDMEEMFRYSFGVIANGHPQEIILSFDVSQKKYIKSLRLHLSQETLVDNKNEFRIRLMMIITDDLVKEILSHGENVKVIKPQCLKSTIVKNCQHTLKYYNKTKE